MMFSGNHDQTKLFLGVMAMLCGGLVTGAWDAPFPTQIERYLWIGCALFTVAAGLWTTIRFLVKIIWSVDVFRDLPHWFQVPIPYVGLGEYLFSRVYFIVESFLSIRKLPWGAYKTTNWTAYIPHL